MVISLTLLGAGLVRESWKWKQTDPVGCAFSLGLDTFLIGAITYVLYAGGFW